MCLLLCAWLHHGWWCPHVGAVDALFQALCDASALNPDSDMEEEAGAQLFFDEAEVGRATRSGCRAHTLLCRRPGLGTRYRGN